MTDEQRLEKLEQAVKLIREVEFSYPVGDETRRMMYASVVEVFSLTRIGQLMTELRKKVRGY